ncbi:MAG: hypothetical protein NTU44_18290, partial [Bacteroidetes bacterium]|nr:hypothetical protein [Bacteroidota bacterium]
MKIITTFCFMVLLALNCFTMNYQIITPSLGGNNLVSDDLLAVYLVFQDNASHDFLVNIEVYYYNEYTPSSLVLSMGTQSISLSSNEVILNDPQHDEILANQVFHDSQFYNYYLTHGKFMSGSYHVCYTFKELAEPQEKMQCIDHFIPFQNTLHLISPFDESYIQTSNPFLTWIYTGVLDAGYSYSITLSEKDSNQTAEEAILNNQMLFSLALDENSLLYPITAIPLEPCKEYAWKVDVTNGSQIVITSEYWSFSIDCPDEDTTTKPDYFYP